MMFRCFDGGFLITVCSTFVSSTEQKLRETFCDPLSVRRPLFVVRSSRRTSTMSTILSSETTRWNFTKLYQTAIPNLV